jgi:flavin-binding protein dodecin
MAFPSAIVSGRSNVSAFSACAELDRRKTEPWSRMGISTSTRISYSAAGAGDAGPVTDTLNKWEDQMSVAKVSEISATSTISFEDAIKQGIARANKTLRKVRSVWIKEQHVRVVDESIAEYQVNMMVTFIIDD